MSENVTGINFTKDPGKDAFIRVKKDQITSDKPIWELAKDLFGLTDEKQIDAVEDAIIEFNNEKVQEEGYRGIVLSEDTKDLEGIIYIPSAGDVLDIEKIEHNDNDEIIKEEEPLELQEVEETDKTDESEDIAGSAGIKDTEETEEVSDTDKVDETDEVNESEEVEETEETDEVDETEETDEATEDKGEKFGFFEGLGAFAKGIFTKGVTNLVKTAFEHPLLTGGVTALAIIGCANPITGPFVLAGLGIAGIFGAVNALKNGMENAEEASDYYAEGEYDKAKESLEDAGGDAFNLGISAFGSVKAFQAASKAASAAKAATSLVDDGLNAVDDGLNAADDGLNASDDVTQTETQLSRKDQRMYEKMFDKAEKGKFQKLSAKEQRQVEAARREFDPNYGLVDDSASVIDDGASVADDASNLVDDTAQAETQLSRKDQRMYEKMFDKAEKGKFQKLSAKEQGQVEAARREFDPNYGIMDDSTSVIDDGASVADDSSNLVDDTAQAETQLSRRDQRMYKKMFDRAEKGKFQKLSEQEQGQVEAARREFDPNYRTKSETVSSAKPYERIKTEVDWTKSNASAKKSFEKIVDSMKKCKTPQEQQEILKNFGRFLNQRPELNAQKYELQDILYSAIEALV